MTAHFLPRLGGVERHVARISSQQAARGHDVTVVAGDHAGDLPADERLGDVRVLRYPALRSMWRMRLWFLAHAGLFRSADVVHVHSPTIVGHVRWGLVPRRKVVHTAHGWGGKYPIPSRQVAAAHRAAARAARLVCVGDFIARWHGVRPDVVTYGAVDVPAELADRPKRPDQLCLLGRLAEDTGVRWLAEGVRAAADGGATMRVVVCGDGPLADEVRAALDHPCIALDMRGFVEQPEEVVAESAVTLTSGYLAILEAMACRSAVVSVADNQVKEDYLALSPMAAMIDICRSSGDVAAAVGRLMADGADPARLDAARGFAAEQTWDRLAGLYETLYEQL